MATTVRWNFATDLLVTAVTTPDIVGTVLRIALCCNPEKVESSVSQPVIKRNESYQFYDTVHVPSSLRPPSKLRKCGFNSEVFRVLRFNVCKTVIGDCILMEFTIVVLFLRVVLSQPKGV